MLTIRSLQGGQLEVVVRERMLSAQDARDAFDRKRGTPDAAVADAYAAFYGWRPPAELIEWAAIAPGYQAVFEQVSDVWMLGGGIEYVAKATPNVEKLLGDHEGVVTLLTGLEPFGRDPSGDSCFVSTLPHPGDVGEVHVYDHETGELDGALYHSIGGLVFSCWTPDEEDRSAEDTQLLRSFDAEMIKVVTARSALLDPRALFARMKWLWGLTTGELGYHFAEDMARAPTYADYEREKPLLATTPVLANYWLLAHYVLGNHQACAEVATLAATVPGTATPALARLVTRLLEAPERARLGALTAKALAELCAAVRKNAEPALLEPAVRDAVERQRSAGVKKADGKQLAARLAAGEDGFALIAEFPDDVAAHDTILTALATTDAALAKTIARYREARAEEDIWDGWPSRWDKVKVDPRLSVAISAAFRAGLAFDSDHKRAGSTLVHTLVHLDDDPAMDGLAAAIEQLQMDDERLEYVVAGLRRCTHPRAKAVLNRAAWRFFDHLDATIASHAKTRKQGATLDNMFRVHSHLLPAVSAVIHDGDDASEALVDKVLSITSNMSVLGTAYAAAFRQVGDKRLERHVRTAGAYCMAVDGFAGTSLPDYASYNVAEAGLALVKLDPARGEALLREMIAKPRSEQLRLDVLGGALAGLLFLHPTDPEILGWADRVLANRTLEERVYGALRGVAEGRVEAARPWVRYHLYAGASSNHIGEKPMLQAAARAALVALGEPEAPPFDETDEFASAVVASELVAALREPGKHQLGHVFQRITEEQVRGPEVLAACGEVLRDVFRFSADDAERSWSVDERTAGLKTLIGLGADALPVLASLLEVEGMAAHYKTLVLYCASLVTDAPALLAWLVARSEAEVLAALAQPTAETIGGLDLIAGYAFAMFGDASFPAIEAAAARRFAMYGESYDAWAQHEPTGGRLARLLARLPGGRKQLATHAKATDNYNVEQLYAHAGEVATPVVDLQGAATSTLGIHMVPDDRDGPRYGCAIGVAGTTVTLTWTGARIYFETMLATQAYEQRGSIEAASAEDARAIADRLCRTLTALGFSTGGADAKAKATKAKPKATKAKATKVKAKAKPRATAAKAKAPKPKATKARARKATATKAKPRTAKAKPKRPQPAKRATTKATRPKRKR